MSELITNFRNMSPRTHNALRGWLASPQSRLLNCEVFDWIPGDAEEQQPYLLAAALYTLHPCSSGYTLGRAVGQLEQDKAVETRFKHTLNANTWTRLASCLRALVPMLKSADVPLDFYALQADLLEWSDDQEMIQRRWAQQLIG